ncbi:cyclic-di-GMP-binding biofilm dispersal mediator protein [Marisediminicola sp. UYEF4]|uniref:SDR family NAD(P)-dependent oxidoreductase n=1 Tax=Marisediminicola sp. UYEF4 TaxID=1756384 RepID=UPI0033954EE8
MTNLEESVVLVVGASGGLGTRIAGLLADAGATVVRAARNPATISGPDAFVADLRDEAAAAAVVAAAIGAHGRLDGVVIAAGAVAFGPVGEVTDAALRELFDINTLAPIRLIREAMPHLVESGAAGREPFIVTLSGVVSEAPTAGLAAYSASKSALAAFTKAASRELRRAGIRIVDARPGHTETGLATRAIAGTAPAFPTGLDPDAVAQRIVTAIADGEKDLPSTAF